MGINTCFARLLVRAREEGAAFGQTATVGRQSMAVPVEDLGQLTRRLDLPASAAHEIASERFADGFFRRLLGAQTITAFDYSDYQGADVVHDFNRPLPAGQARRYNALIDGGTIEHIFDVRQVLANYMTMVRLGGRVFLNTPANNLFGHGFYQFSSELFFRVFDPANGFETERVCLIETPFLSVEISREQACYETVDPARLGKRVLLANNRPVMLYVQARRVSDVEPFAQPPLQSDYKVKWVEDPSDRRAESSDRDPDGAPDRPFTYIGRAEAVRRALRQRRKNSFRNRRFFRPFQP
jgi:hypothetical protein